MLPAIYIHIFLIAFSILFFTLFYKLWRKRNERKVVGWKEQVALPDLKIKSVIAKIDTGANVATIDLLISSLLRKM